MSDIVLVAALTLLTSLVGAVSSTIAARRGQATTETLKGTNAKIDSVIVKHDASDVIQGEIHRATNSGMTAALAEIKAGRDEITALKTAAVKEIHDQMEAMKVQLAEARDAEMYEAPVPRRRRPKARRSGR